MSRAEMENFHNGKSDIEAKEKQFERLRCKEKSPRMVKW